MSQRRHRYCRVMIDDSSNEDDADTDDNDQVIDKTQHHSNDESDENMDASVRDVSHLLETLSFTKRNNCGHRVDQRDDEETSIDEDTYLEDSFLVKDYSPSEENSSNVSIDVKSYEGRKSSSNSRKQGKARKKKTKEKLTDFSSFFKDDLSDASGVDENKISVLLDLYPELKENLEPKSNKSSNGSEPGKHSDPEERDETSDEKFEKFLQQVGTTQPPVTPANTYGTYALDGFVVTDSESSVTECTTSECESIEQHNGSNDAQLIPDALQAIQSGERYLVQTGGSNNGYNGYPVQFPLPAAEKQEKREELSNLFSGSQNAPDTQKNNQSDDDAIFLLALSPNGPAHPEALKYTTTKFPRIREELTKKLYGIYRKRCFEDKLDPNMLLEWNARLRLTAGRCRCIPNGTASIELSIKVCDTPERLRDTMLHELCHAAVWVLDHIHKGGHGPAWKYWVYRCRKVFPMLPLIERCHKYKIDAKYLYICAGCGQTIKRHSKSLDTTRKVCGLCNGRFMLRTRDGKQVSTKPANTFAQFVKANYKNERKPGVKHAEIMKILSQRFKQEKEAVPEPAAIVTVE